MSVKKQIRKNTPLRSLKFGVSEAGYTSMNGGSVVRQLHLYSKVLRGLVPLAINTSPLAWKLWRQT